jgi:hypothetical protein
MVRDGAIIHGKTMVLRGYFYFASGQIFDWLVATTVPKLEFKGARTHGDREQLVSKTNAKYWDFAVN